ncbi:complement C1q-like protein 3 [Crassostrea angulata]|uniref:complement C1q-like protein 3 n=1 Tax=Magallana angulata TaxID=2784310 RepID=UPI0022B1C57F|nr:complement C1q-like protein 3 [Crassostrea angulata]
MFRALLFALFFGFLSLTKSSVASNLQTGIQTKVDLLKSLIYDNTKATVTLDSSAFKELIQLSSESPSSPRRVSFSVSVKSTSLTLGARQTVKYDAVLTNDGNGYDDRTGIFTCPVAGTYMFVVDSLSWSGIWLELKVNKMTVGRLNVRYGHKVDLIQMSRTVIVKLKPGDHVKVENYENGGKIYFNLYSGFTGALLY